MNWWVARNNATQDYVGRGERRTAAKEAQQNAQGRRVVGEGRNTQ